MKAEQQPPPSSRGASNLRLPRIVFGTGSLGNQYEALPEQTKSKITQEWFKHAGHPVFLDTAGKYGAGLALESIGKHLRHLAIAPENVVISNKLGWKRTPLRGLEPTFEPEVWANLQHDAEQQISYAGILDCWRQGCELLGAPYTTQLVSVHDPDEYLHGAKTESERKRRLENILDAYRALNELKQSGQVTAIGVGCKTWQVVRQIVAEVPLDWVMLANSLTIYRHPLQLLQFVNELAQRGIAVINSAVFHAGFFTGGEFFDYRKPTPDREPEIFAWRAKFLELCRQYSVSPTVACVQFALSPPGVAAVALNTSRPSRVAENVAAVETTVPSEFWAAAKTAGLIAADYPYLVSTGDFDPSQYSYHNGKLGVPKPVQSTITARKRNSA
jgi:D-threo-aldose 1-dehydrogenase